MPEVVAASGSRATILPKWPHFSLPPTRATPLSRNSAHSAPEPTRTWLPILAHRAEEDSTRPDAADSVQSNAPKRIPSPVHLLHAAVA